MLSKCANKIKFSCQKLFCILYFYVLHFTQVFDAFASKTPILCKFCASSKDIFFKFFLDFGTFLNLLFIRLYEQCLLMIQMHHPTLICTFLYTHSHRSVRKPLPTKGMTQMRHLFHKRCWKHGSRQPNGARGHTFFRQGLWVPCWMGIFCDLFKRWCICVTF